MAQPMTPQERLKDFVRSLVPMYRIKDIAAYAGLAVFTTYIWCREYRIGGEQKMSAPIEYWGDALATEGAIRATSEFSYLPFVSKTMDRLGAPYVARWDDYPVTEDLLFFFWGMVARVVGVFKAVNLAYLSAAVLAAWSLYYVARYLRAKRSVAFSVAMAFGLSRYIFWRNVHHFTLSFYWPAPLFVLLAMRLASKKGIRFGTPAFRWAIALSLLGGTGNPYYINFQLQLVVIGALIGYFGHKLPWRRALPAVALVGAQLAGFISMNMDSIWARITLGPNKGAFKRTMGHMEQYALRPIDLVVPRGTSLMKDLPKNFLEYDQVSNHGEPSYIGIVASVGLVWLLFDAFYRVASRRMNATTQWALSVIVLIAYTMTAGANMLLGMAGFELFRSTNRSSIFIMAIALLFLATRITTLLNESKLGTKVPKYGLALVLWIASIFVAWNGIKESHPTIEHDRIAAQRAQAESDAAFVHQLEAKVPPMGGVFVIPWTSAPEGDPYPWRMFIHSKSIRMSWGNPEGRPESVWYHQVASMKYDQMIDAAEASGFSAFCAMIMGETRAAPIIKTLMDKGRTDIIRSPNGEWVCGMLQPTGPFQPPGKLATAPAAPSP